MPVKASILKRKSTTSKSSKGYENSLTKKLSLAEGFFINMAGHEYKGKEKQQYLSIKEHM